MRDETLTPEPTMTEATKRNETRDRMMGELEELEKLTANAPEDHPARVALAKVRDKIESNPDHNWWIVYRDASVRQMANEVAAGRSID